MLSYGTAFLFSVLLIPAAADSRASTFDIRDYGARADKSTDNAAAVQKAIDACHKNGGGTVLIPPGDFLAGNIRLKSYVTLHLEVGATLRASTDPAHYAGKPRHLLTADNSEHVSITGFGTLHGQGTGDVGRRPGHASEPRPSFRTQVIVFTNCKQVAMRGFKLLYSDSWAVHLERCEKVFIDGVTILNNYFRTNSDGIDPVSCRDVHISNCHITAGDDTICLKTTGGHPCENVVITNCTLESVATAIKLGTQSNGPFRNIMISNCVVRNSVVGVGFFVKDGGTIERVTVSNLSIGTVEDPSTVNAPRLRRAIYPIFLDIEQRRDDSPVGAIRDVIFRDIHIESDNGILIQGMRESPIENLTLENILFRVAKGFDYSDRRKHAGGTANPNDDRITLYARKPSYMTLAHIKGLVLDNVRVNIKEDVFKHSPRSALSIYEATDGVLRGIHRQPGGADAEAPIVTLDNCQRMFLTSCSAPPGTGVFLGLSGSKTSKITLAGNNLDESRQAVTQAKEVRGDAVKSTDNAIKELPNPFYAMDTNLRDTKTRTPEQVAKMLKDMGYSGYGHSGTKDIEKWLSALNKHGLTMFNTYVGLNLDTEPKFDPALEDAISQLARHHAMIWLNVQSNRFDRASRQGDEVAVEAIRELAGYAHEHGVRIALYPHTSFYVESVDDAVRVAEKVNRRNVGITFNLCHWLKVDGEKGMRALMVRAVPYLFQVSVNGADRGETQKMNWDRLIQPLDSGTFDVSRFVGTLRELGYRGPIGLQGYGIRGDSEAHLKRSIAAWRNMQP